MEYVSTFFIANSYKNRRKIKVLNDNKITYSINDYKLKFRVKLTKNTGFEIIVIDNDYIAKKLSVSIIYQNHVNTIDEANDIRLKLFSEANSSGPFVITGQSSSYRELGYFSSIPEKISNMPSCGIDFENLSSNKYYSTIIIDCSTLLCTFCEILYPLN